MSADQNRKPDRLPDAELDVMLVLWNAQTPMKTSKILEQLNWEKNWSISTLQSLLSRLSDRGFVRAEKNMRFKYYRPVVREDDYKIWETRQFVQRLHGNSCRLLIETLLNDHAFEVSDIQYILQLLTQALDDEND